MAANVITPWRVPRSGGALRGECGIAVALGVRATGELRISGIWISAGLLLGLLLALNKVENDLVHVARHYAGMPQMRDADEVRAPRGGLLRGARRLAGLVPLHKVFHSVELSILVLIAAIIDLFVDGAATKVLLAALVVVAGVTLIGHLAVLASPGCDERVWAAEVWGHCSDDGQPARRSESRARQCAAPARVDLDVAVVGNGWQPVGLPDRVKAHGLSENLGIPAGRNAGVSLVEGELLFFLDDACLPADDILARMAMQFAADPTRHDPAESCRC